MYPETDKTRVSIWVGVASSEDRLHSYVEDDYSVEDDEPTSEFCADFDLDGVDEDFREVSSREMTTSLTALLGEHSYVQNFLQHALAANGGDQLDQPANAIILLYAYVIPAARGSSNKREDPAMQFFGAVGPTGMPYSPDVAIE